MSARERARKVLSKVTPGHPLTSLPGPRVLVEDPGTYYSGYGPNYADGYIKGSYDPVLLADRLRATVPTVEVATSLDDFNLSEWDCLVTNTAPTRVVTTQEPQQYHDDPPKVLHSWEQRYPSHLSVIYLVPHGSSIEALDAFPPEGTEQPDLPDMLIVRDPDTVGRHIRQVVGLPEHIAALVARDLVPTARERNKHSSFRRWVDEGYEPEHENDLALRPFLLGPDDVTLAGSYERNDDASVWLVPNDVPDVTPWVIEALREWHGLYPKRFPLVPDWHGAVDWRTAAERVIADQRARLDESFKAQFDEYQRQLAGLDDKANDARRQADGYQRALLTEDGDPLAEAVGCALAALGFHVVDMDEHWPSGDRREDLRVFDEADPDWVAIVEVKGAKGGAKETEVQNFGRWAERFIIEHHRAPSARWFVTNHQRTLDPSGREQAFANKPAVLTTFAKVDGSVIDTRALFDLVRLVEEEPRRASAARALLKGNPDVVTRVTQSDLGALGPVQTGAHS